ncbi:MAG: nucleotidyl transferase AbiEii/AbiGii toxin family protein [Rhodobacteraceae bacterium]|nr:nucleotidyl transferase AbiEii/AbiGii toxin family protein [Paracoccaceae bacterium]MCY4249785.1 nucleotidyl transferase AbiEii/AbiGii toxin family protein [Paracoccaceae bacterium]MCY4308586.1 nucleotidyl transferase AbiEii/AbiGii toxin family protein [Paracoccaceae bacterium]
MLTRGLDRHSVDLDFDAGKRLNIERRIRQGVMAAGMELLSLTMPRNTATGQRFHVHYRDRVTGVSDMLRVETSFRSPPQASQVETVNCIRTYRLEHLIGQKITALTNRTKVRDLYDLAFLARMHGNHFTQEQIQETRSLLHDPDGAVARFQGTLAEDRTLAGRVKVEDMILDLMETMDTIQAPTDPEEGNNPEEKTEPSTSADWPPRPIP